MLGGHADIYTETLRVPLIVNGPGINVGRISQTVSSMSVAPSILNLVGLELGDDKDAPSLLPLMFGEEGYKEPESLLVVGYPSYTRSIGLRYKNLYFIRNLEGVYKSIAVGSAPEEVQNRPTRKQAEVVDGGDSGVFLIPSIAASPQRVTLDIVLKPGCTAEANISLPFDLNLLTFHPQDRRSRVEYTIARLDPVFVNVNPASCAEQVSWEAIPLSTPETPTSVVAGTSYETDLYSGLLTWRKKRNGDELYDLASDPGMSNNLIHEMPSHEVERLRTRLQTLLRERKVAPATPATASSDEMERLRSLGYIQ
jgi:hypothetical protein